MADRRSLTPASTEARKLGYVAPPAATDLRTILGDAAFRTFTDGQLPAGLVNEAARRVLTGIGMPELQESGLGIAAHRDGFLAEFSWPEAGDEPESEGPFFRLGRWMGGTVVLDGTGGQVLRVPANDDGPDGVLVAASLEGFLTMVALWLVGLRIHATVDGDDERYALRVNIRDELWMIDEVGGMSEAWIYLLENE
ncbi:SUKH-4 family immunity protein [Streptomyces sp. NPDC048483]|uniref:SUKH-4 family immunity protein n=1 Tax=Streptomyces sp. NPDC048483 TaxID=3154927 RepID=UPI00341B0F62